MRILHLITDLGGGGAERQLCLLAHGLVREGATQQVVALTAGGVYRRELESGGIETIELGLSRGTVSLTAPWKLRRVVRRFRPDVLHAWMYHANLAATIARCVGVAQPALVWGIRNSLEAPHTYRPMTRVVIRVNRWLSRRPERIVYNSRASASQHAQAGFDDRAACVIPNGIDVQRFSPSPLARARMRASLGLRDDRLVIGNASRLDPGKNHPALLRAFARVAAQRPDLHLLLCGSGVADSNVTLVSEINGLGISGKVTLLGERGDVADVISAWDIGLNASVREGFPNMVAESMACGVPCVVTDAGDTRDIVGDTGYVTTAGDEDALGMDLQHAAELAADARAALGRAARARIERLYSVDSMIQQYLDLYAGIARAQQRG